LIFPTFGFQHCCFPDTFDGFETWVLESKMVNCMTGNLGRKSRFSTFVITGNGNGLAGFALGKAPAQKAALKTAKNRAGLRLMYIPRYKEHTGNNTIAFLSLSLSLFFQ
jgi:small subunit ribosomal protein S5